MNNLKDKILTTKTMADLDSLRLEIVRDEENFQANQRLFIKQKNKIKRHGGRID